MGRSFIGKGEQERTILSFVPPPPPSIINPLFFPHSNVHKIIQIDPHLPSKTNCPFSHFAAKSTHFLHGFCKYCYRFGERYTKKWPVTITGVIARTKILLILKTFRIKILVDFEIQLRSFLFENKMPATLALRVMLGLIHLFQLYASPIDKSILVNGIV